MPNKEKYRLFCKHEKSIPIFSQAWWLDSVVGDNWNVALVEKNGMIQATLPFTTRQYFGLTSISQPTLTQTLGPWLRPSMAKYAKQLSQEKELLQKLFQQLPKVAYYSQNWHHTRTNWLPLYWLGYEQTTRYTYRIEVLTNVEKVWDGFEAKIRTDIRKAQNKEGVKVRTDLTVDEFLNLNEKVFQRQGMALPYTREYVNKLDAALEKNNSRRIFIAVDEEGRHHAAVYLVWDDNSAYYLMGGGDPDLRNSGATSLCMWEAIQFAATVTKSFDFEGSMIEPVERFFRGFGAKQIPYFTVSKTNSKLLKAYKFLQGIRK
ncbi:GNAT family N-acetyltransferase [Suttonella sp. R2A3]|uniref:GNAT family N-acetyltransferase n=1 Tax=Suttonella sp. R2A3 TaxID=2908648 RepID=UPI001F27E750|nr:GNAT family N-acetyltransferase [Suttonella sp. R2A3]UJF25437.1 GNAT family N-acetyltransferase [Suttonella sp. R2A3]